MPPKPVFMVSMKFCRVLILFVVNDGVLMKPKKNAI